MERDWGRCGAASGRDGERFFKPVAVAHPSWSGLPIEMQLLPGDVEATDIKANHATLAIARAGRGKRRYVSAGRLRHLYSAPAMFELYSADYVIDQACWQGECGEVLSIQFPTSLTNALLQAEGAGFRLETIHEQFDSRLTDLAFALWAEAAGGSPRGRLYAEGLSMAILGLLVDVHGARGAEEAARQSTLSNMERRVITEYIEAHLSESISVQDLADVLHMSASRFTRSFKSTFGVSPHAYVVERRINVACTKLRSDRLLSLAEVACALGFSSQSHFTDAFRRRVGTTPGIWRAN